MVTGFNTDVEHAGTMYHVQTQERGRDDPVIETLVYSGGQIVASIVDSYADLLELDGDVAAFLLERMRGRHSDCVDSLRRGRVDALERDIRAIESAALDVVVQNLDARLTEAALRKRRRRLPEPRRVAAVLAVAVVLAVLALMLRSPRKPERAAATAPMPRLERSSGRIPPPATAEPVEVPAPALPAAEIAAPAAVEPPSSASPTPGQATPREPAPVVQSAPPPQPVERPPIEAREAPPAEAPAAVPPVVERPPVILPPPVQAEPPPQPVPKAKPAEPPVDWTGKLVAYADVDVPPRAVRRDLPRYSKRARKRKESGTVRMELLIDQRGRVADVRFVAGIAGSDLNDVAVEAARAWTFHPATREGKPVLVWKPVELEFYLAPGNLDVVRVVEDTPTTGR